MAKKGFHSKHISTKAGVIILGILLLGVIIAISQLSKNQILFSNADSSGFDCNVILNKDCSYYGNQGCINAGAYDADKIRKCFD